MQVSPLPMICTFLRRVLLLSSAVIFFGTSLSGQTSSGLYFPTDSNEWERLPLENLKWNRESLAELLAWMPTQDSRALIILKDGKIVIEEYWGSKLTGTGAMDESSLWYWGAAGRTLTASMVGLAQQAKLLSIKDKTQTYLGVGWTSMSPLQEQEIQLIHHLSMSTGIDEEISDLQRASPDLLTFRAKPGVRWAEHYATYSILEQVLEKASGQSLQDLFKSQIGDPIGMRGLWQKTADTYVFYSDARSFARFGLLHLAEGKWADTKIWSGSYFAKMTQSSQKSNPSYGYLTWLNGQSSYRLPGVQRPIFGSLVPSAPSDMYLSVGEGAQVMMVIPSENLVIIRMGGNVGESYSPFVFVREFWEKMAKVIGG